MFEKMSKAEILREFQLASARLDQVEFGATTNQGNVSFYSF